MPSTPRFAAALAVLTALLLGAGCTTTVPGAAAADSAAPPTTAAAADPVAWVDEVCGALLPFVRSAGTPPQLDSASDPATLVKGLGDYLGQASGAAGTAITGMAAAGPSPVAGGDGIVSGLTDTLTSFQTSFQDARTKIDALDTSDPQALLVGLPPAIAPLEQLANLPDPTAGLKSSPELDRASQQAPNCQQVQATTGG
jgi:hypothetical protein